MMDAMPEEMVARLLTHSKEVGHDIMRRYGLAILVNTCFLDTEYGRYIFELQKRQLMLAVKETIAYGAVFHILNVIRDHMNRSGSGGDSGKLFQGTLTKADIDRIFMQVDTHTHTHTCI